MKLIRFGDRGLEKPGVITRNGKRIDVSGFGSDYDEVFFAGDGVARLAAWLEDRGASAPEVGEDVRLGPPVSRPGKIICIGLNFRDHAAESNMTLPQEPVIFFKATSALSGPDDDVIIPRGSEKTDWEVELAVVIGKAGRDIPRAEALRHVFGYTAVNDLSARDLQTAHLQWFKGKSLDGFCPMGPVIVTADEFGDPQRKRLQSRVNGAIKQGASTSDMIFPVDAILEWLSKGMTLEPGDIIATGTPEGVGMGRTPPEFLQPGDVVEIEVEGIGTLRNRIVRGSGVI